MTQEQVRAMLEQKLARAKHSAAWDALAQHESVWAGVRHDNNARSELRRRVHNTALDMIKAGAAKPWGHR